MTPTPRTEALALIRERCVEANPEIIELKPGCMVELRYGGNSAYSLWELVAGTTDFNRNDIWKCIDSNFVTVSHSDQISGKNYKVVGRSIRLADIVLAVESRNIPVNDAWYGFTRNYDLGNDSLDAQDDETIEFLSELIK